MVTCQEPLRANLAPQVQDRLVAGFRCVRRGGDFALDREGEDIRVKSQ